MSLVAHLIVFAVYLTWWYLCVCVNVLAMCNLHLDVFSFLSSFMAQRGREAAAQVPKVLEGIPHLTSSNLWNLRSLPPRTHGLSGNMWKLMTAQLSMP